MKIFEINAVPYGSTGRIMFQIANTVNSMGGTAFTSASFTKSRGEKFPDTYYRIGGAVGKTEHIILAKLTGRHGCYSHFATFKLIQKIKQVHPDIIHLHNIHGWYLNWKMLFDYLKKANIPVVWTLHDCWSFTGHCPHFEAVCCEKWKTGCCECPLYKLYPGCFFDDSRFQYTDKSVRLGSSSGAIFSPLAEYVLERRGVVYGVKMSEDCYSSEFTRVSERTDLIALRGSKYLQAKVGNTYKYVKEDLTAGRLVLFSGTGCQINGLKTFLGRQYDNLLCVDVICHGVPSPALWKKYAKFQEKKNWWETKSCLLSV